MPGIEELHFEVILDHSKFDQEIKKVESIAKELNIEVSKALDLKKQVNAINNQVAINEQKIAQETAKTALAQEKVATQKEKTKTQAEKTATAAERHARAVSSTNTQLVTTQSLMSTIAQLTGIAFGVAGLRAFTSQLITITGQFEVQKMALTSMLQSADKADEIFNQLRKNALESPYTFADLTKFAKQLTAFNIPADKLVETEKMLADVAAAVGVDMGRIILAYGQVKAAGALKGQELRQFTEAGVPILEELAKQIEETEGKAISLAAVFDRISKKKIPFAMVEESFRRMTSEGGKFYNMQEVLVETLQGKIGKLRDVWQQALYDLGQSNDTVLKGAVDWITKLVGHLDLIVKILVPVIAGFGTYKAALLLAASAQKVVMGVNVVKHLINLATGARGASAALKALGASGAAAALGIAALVAVVGVELYRAYNKTDREMRAFKAHLDDIRKSAEAGQEPQRQEVTRLQQLLKIAKDVNAEAGVRQAAVDELNKAIPKLNGHINETTGAYIANNKVLSEHLDLLIKNAKAAAKRSELEALAVEEDNLKEQIAAAEDEVAKWTGLRDQKATSFSYNIAGTSGASSNLSFGAKVSEAERNLESLNGQLTLTQKRMSQLEDELKKGDFDVSKVLGWNPDDWNGNSPFKQKDPAVVAAEERIDLLKRIKEAYDKLKPYMTDNDLNDTLTELFGSESQLGVSFDNLDQSILQAIDHLGTLGDEAKKEADKMRAAFKFTIIEQGYKKAEEENKKAEKALQDFYKTLNKWQTKDNSQDGTGVYYDITKAYADAKTRLNQIDQEYKDAKANLEKSKSDFKRDLLGQLQEERDWEKESVGKGFIDKISALYKEVFSAGMEGFDLSNWNDKTLFQIKAIRDALKQMEIDPSIIETLEKLQDPTSGIEDTTKAIQEVYEKLSQTNIPQNVIDFFMKPKEDGSFGVFDNPTTLEAFIQLLQKLSNLVKSTEDNTVKPENAKAWGRTLKDIASGLSDVAEAAIRYGKAIDNPDLVKSAQILQDVVKETAKIATSIAEENYLEAGVELVTYLISEWLEAAAAVEEYKKALAAAQEEYRHANYMSDFDSFAETIFGTDDLAKYKNAIDATKTTLAEFKNLLNMKLPSYSTTDNKWSGTTYKGFTVLQSLERDGFGDKIYNANGTINVEGLKQLQSLYPAIADSLQLVINKADEYNNALLLSAEITESVLGSVAEDAAENIVNSWIEAGNAALDYASILDDVARTYAQMTVKSMIMEALPKDLAQNLGRLMYEDNEAGFMELLASAMQEIEEMAPYIEKALQAFDPYFIRDTEEEGSLGRGIKSITEETASILASYLNAVRADVSVLRSIAERQEAGTMAWGESLPALRDYIQKIEAHTANTAENTASILSRIDNVLNASGEMIRVELN